MKLSQVIARFRDGKDAIGASAIIAGRPDAIRLLAAFISWPLPQWTQPEAKAPSDRRALWLWLWEGFEGGQREPDFLHDLAEAAGISAEVAFRLWPQLLSARAVYPDGTLSAEARALLDAHIGRHLPKSTTKPKRAKRRTTKKASDHESGKRRAKEAASGGDRGGDGGGSDQDAERRVEDGNAADHGGVSSDALPEREP